MKSPLQRRTAIAALLLAPTLAACGFSAQTDQVYQPAAGTNYRSGDVYILNAVVVSSTDGSGTFAGTLVNQTDQPQALTQVTGDGITAETGGGEALQIPADGYNNLGEPGDTVPPAKLTLTGPANALKPGGYLDLTFSFASGSTVTMKVPVFGPQDQYSEVPTPAPSPSATAAGKKQPTSPSTATESPSAS